MKEFICSVTLPSLASNYSWDDPLEGDKTSSIVSREINLTINGEERLVKVSPNTFEHVLKLNYKDSVSLFVVDVDIHGEIVNTSETLKFIVEYNVKAPVLNSIVEFSSEIYNKFKHFVNH